MAQKTFLLCCFAVGCIFGIAAAQLQCTYERDEAAAGRNCERACRTDGTCRKQNRECICDGRCGPVCLRKTCPALAQPGNGSILINPSGRFIGSEATYSCDDGFQVVGNSARICQANKTWNGTEPTCQKSTAPIITTPIPVTCERLPSPLNGREILGQQNGDVVAVGTMVRFQCNDGYVRTSGSLRRICREDGRWSGSDAVCSAVAVEQCARDDQEIQNQNRRCMRPCESSSDCLRGRPCVCDDICGLSCIPIDRTDHCEDLPSDQSVRVRITPNDRTFGSTAQYECRSGHEEDGGSHERKCVGSGQWSGVPLTCIPRVRCGQPPEIANSVHNGTKAYYVNGDIVIYRCNYGYYRSGYLPLSRCSRDAWSEIQFQCLPKSCGDPGHILNGRRIGSSFVFLGSVEFMCNPGYEMRGLSRRYCQADQQWSGSLPTCHPVRCPDPGVPDFGIKIGSDYSYDEIVSFECNTRYILEGQSSLRCQANGTWSAPRPTCRLIQCRRPDEPSNGHSDATFEYYGQQGAIRFTCDEGYTLRGSGVITCDEHEQWSPPPPLCLGRCRIPSCPSNGRWTMYGNSYYSNCRTRTMVDPGFHLTYECNDGFFKCQQIEPVCNDRVWEPSPRNLCVPKGCNVETLRDSQLTASYTYDGATECFHQSLYQQQTVIEYSCNLGYKIRDGDPRQATCVRRSWLPSRQPVCVEVTCPYLQFPFGSVTYQQNGPYISNRGHTALARFNCIEGYRLEGHTISCNNGVWNDTTPICVEEPCFVYYVEQYNNINVEFVVPPGSNENTAVLKPPRTTANFVCTQHGFEASQTKRCERGIWRGEDPRCSRIRCEHEDLENGEVTYTPHDNEQPLPVHGVIRSYDCNPGFIIDNNELSECDAGIWTRRLPVCNERSCNKDDLLDIEWDFEIQYTNVEEGDELEEFVSPWTVATIRCNVTGYETTGRNSRTCRRGEWEGQNPSCERIRCEHEALRNGEVIYTLDDNEQPLPVHGVIRSYDCNPGYIIDYNEPSECYAGTWTRGLPVCNEKPCNKDDLLNSEWDFEIQFSSVGERHESERFVSPRTVATLSCNRAGYETTGRDKRTCRRGEWGGQNPYCERIRCQTIQLENGAFEYWDIDSSATLDPRHGDIRNATCDRGYVLQGAEEAQCRDGRWEGELPICIEESCNKDHLPTGDWQIDFNYPAGINATTHLMKPPFTEARFRCTALGYVITGGEVSTCRRGEWNGQNPSCEISTCETFRLKNGRLEYSDNNGVNIAVPKHGDYMIATCDEGYHLEGVPEEIRCWEGVWEDPQPTCEENPCRIFTEGDIPSYLEVIYTSQDGSIISPNDGFFPGKSLANFTCRENGTRIQGNSQRTCKRGDWRGRFPECENDTCPTENIDNGRVTNDDLRPFTQQPRHGDWRRFTCDQGYTVDGEDRSQCLDGEWSQEKPTCIEAICRVDIANGDTTRQDGSRFTEDARHNDWRRVTCDDGYTLDGQVWSVCRDGRWFPESPTCEETQCPAVENNGEYERILYHGQTSAAQSFPSGTVLEVDCAEGRVSEGPSTSVCERGLWDPPRLLCVHTAPCQEIPVERGRTIDYTDNTGSQKQHDSNLTVTCESHTVRFGQNKSRCVNGAWSPPVANCKENLALGKDTQQVSTDYDGFARKAVDGITNGRYDFGSCSHTSRNSDPQWWYVDLGSTVLVQEIVIYNREDNNHHERLLHATVRVGVQTSDVTLNQRVGTVNSTEINPIHIHLNPAIEGRIVSVSELFNGEPLTLCEVQVFGELLGCLSSCEVPHLQNGYFTLRTPQRRRVQPNTCVPENELIYANCQQGLHVRGSHYYRCQPPGEWVKDTENDPICHTCHGTQCVVPYIENGYYYWNSNGRRIPLANGTCTPPGEDYLYLLCEDSHRDGFHYYTCREGELNTGNRGNHLSSCIRDISNEHERRCSSPGPVNLVQTFVGSDYTPLIGQETFSEGDFITSRCQNPKKQQFHGSVTRRCVRGQWSGDAPRCDPTIFFISVENTALQNVTENGTIIVYPITGFVTIKCKVISNVERRIKIYKNNERLSSYQDMHELNLQRWRIYDPTEANSGTYKCESIGQSLSIDIIFKDIRCQYPRLPPNGTWRHNRAGANPSGHLGFIFMETVTLMCPTNYRASDSPTRPTCSYHGTWINLSQTCIRYRLK